MQGSPESRGKPKTVTAVLRALDLLDTVNRSDTALRLTDLAVKTGLSKATAHRLLNTLLQRELVEYDRERERYFPGPRILEYGLRRLQGLDLRRIALPHMERLREQTRETVTLSVITGFERQYIEQLESPQEVRMTVELGRRMPLYAGGSGKAILAFLSPERLEEYFRSVRFEPLTPYTNQDPDTLRRELETVRAAGYGFGSQERQNGAASVAAPIFGRNARVLGCFSVSGPYERFRGDTNARFGPLVREAAHAVSRALGWLE